jgi:L-amino acid N-acyltransferase YncA
MSAGRCRSTGRCCSLFDARDRTAISIRDIADADLPALIEIFNREIVESPYLYIDAPVTIDDRRSWLNAHVASDFPVIVAVEPDQSDALLGWASLSPYRPSSGYRFTAEISVYVAPLAQRRGLGSRLVSLLCDDARQRGLHALVASIDSENAPSIALFERLGFVEAARLQDVGRKFNQWRTQLLLVRTFA